MGRFGPLTSSFLGFDSFFDELDRMLDNAGSAVNFPPLNLYKEKDGYSIELAVAGYCRDQITIEHDKKRSVLTIKGDNTTSPVLEGRELIKQGIAARSFFKSFTLADNLIVKDATFKDGILSVRLEQIEVPEDKPLLITLK